MYSTAFRLVNLLRSRSILCRYRCFPVTCIDRLGVAVGLIHPSHSGLSSCVDRGQPCGYIWIMLSSLVPSHLYVQGPVYLWYPSALLYIASTWKESAHRCSMRSNIHYPKLSASYTGYFQKHLAVGPAENGTSIRRWISDMPADASHNQLQPTTMAEALFVMIAAESTCLHEQAKDEHFRMCLRKSAGGGISDQIIISLRTLAQAVLVSAVQVLSDDDKRGKFDRGEDVEVEHEHNFHNPFGGGFGGGGQQFTFHFGG